MLIVTYFHQHARWAEGWVIFGTISRLARCNPIGIFLLTGMSQWIACSQWTPTHLQLDVSRRRSDFGLPGCAAPSDYITRSSPARTSRLGRKGKRRFSMLLPTTLSGSSDKSTIIVSRHRSHVIQISLCSAITNLPDHLMFSIACSTTWS